MTIGDAFSKFCSNLYVSNPVTISQRYERIVNQLNRDFWGYESKTSHRLYTGSYGRDTAIDGISDLDMIFWLSGEDYSRYHSHQGNGQSRMLQDVKDSIQRTYTSTKAGGDGQVVVVSFTDMVIEVQPCFLESDGSFTYPDSNGGGSWKKTDPRPEIDAINTMNNKRNKNLKRLCRMMRAWKYKWNVPIKGLLIDTLAYRFMEANPEYAERTSIYYDWLSRDFFKFLYNQNESQSYWQAPGSNQLVWRTGNFEYKAGRCHTLSDEAIAFDAKEMEWSRNNRWRDIYGTRFPEG